MPGHRAGHQIFIFGAAQINRRRLNALTPMVHRNLIAFIATHEGTTRWPVFFSSFRLF
jgi:hypothetical protein